MFKKKSEKITLNFAIFRNINSSSICIAQLNKGKIQAFIILIHPLAI